MKPVLFLDDNQARINRFRSINPDATIVTTASDCINEITNHFWSEVWLDHDLNGEIFVDSNRSDCGMEVVRYIEKTTQHVAQSLQIPEDELTWDKWNEMISDEYKIAGGSPLVGKFVVHTANYKAAIEMEERLLNIKYYEVERKPFEGAYDPRGL